MHDEPLWLEPDYFEKFCCKCGACRSCCCDGWDIAVSREEYFRLIGMECSDELHHRLECAFRIPEDPSPERYRLISSNWLGECPIRDVDGLCLLQKECGEGALPEVCRVYPRSLKQEGELFQACCTGGCEAVVEMLMQEDRLRFRFARLHVRPELRERGDVPLQMMGRICIEYLQDRSFSLRDRLRSVGQLLCGGESSASGQLQDGLAAFRGALPVLERRSLAPFRDEVLALWEDAQGYAGHAVAFECRFPDWERWMENLLVNHLICLNFPLVDARMSYEEAYKGLCGTWALLRMVCIAHTRLHARQEDFADAAAAVFRLVEHSAFYYNSHVLLENPDALLAL